MIEGEPTTAAQPAPVRVCGACGQQWQRWPDFIQDPKVRILGLQVVPDMPEANLLVFEHACGSTISVLASRLRHLVDAPPPSTTMPCLYGTTACGQECRHIKNLSRCDRQCRNAVDRQLTILIDSVKQGRQTLA
jgi:hypothetical protein